MSSVKLGKEFFLAHYADPYYDPAKAHEYYLENRQLQPNQPSSAAPLPSIPKPPGPETPAQAAARAAQNKAISAANKASAAARKSASQHQAEALAYSSKQISDARKAEETATTEAQKQRVAKLQDDATGTKNRIEQALNEAISKIEASTKIKLDVPKLNEIPANASAQQKAFLQAQNRKIQARSDAKNRAAQNAANKKAGVDKTKAHADAAEQKKQLGLGLKKVVAEARANYAQAKVDLHNKYKQISVNEKANIKANVQ